MPIRIFIDQGHNPYGVNAGAEGFGLREQDITYLVGIYLSDLLNADERFVATTSRKTPEEILGTSNTTSLQTRVRLAAEWNADYFLSIHVNASENPAANGTEAYVYQTGSEAYYLGDEIVREITLRLGTKNNGTFARPSLYVLRRTSMPAVLIELAYITNYEDALLLSTEQYAFAYAIYMGLLDFFDFNPQS